MILVSRLMLGAALLVCPALSFTQTAAPTAAPTAADSKADSKSQAEVSFQFDRIGLPVPHFTLRVREDGTGSYQADQAEIPATSTGTRGQAAQHIDRPINLSSTTVAKIFKAARGTDRFNIECASKAKNIADTGKKTLTYTGADASGSCTYNYSENKSISALTDILLAITYTLDEGRKLDFLHRYDRLGLDAEMISFGEEYDAGRAMELQTITPALASIANDNALIQRVRLKAQKMLEQASWDR